MALKKYWSGSDAYLCDKDLAQAFHMSRTLSMPLLIEGEPGTGKTELAIQYAKDTNLQLFVYPVGSKSNIEQFVAKFDHVKYLRDSQIEILNAQREEKGLKALHGTGGRSSENLADYVIKGPAVKAFENPNSILLIDEIDKAPREFPNDLLYALSHRQFVLPESGEIIQTSEDDMPAIIITSNREQELPTAFKGRCIYHYIDFPNAETMNQIILKHLPDLETKVINSAINIFYQLRNMGLERAPTTREILNWLKYIKQFAPQESVDKINRLEGLGSLIKTQQDLERVQQLILRDPDDFGRRSLSN